MWSKETSYPADGDINWHNQFWTVLSSRIKLKIKRHRNSIPKKPSCSHAKIHACMKKFPAALTVTSPLSHVSANWMNELDAFQCQMTKQFKSWFHLLIQELQWQLQTQSSWAISIPERWCCESAALNMSANLENSAMATGLEKVFSFQPQRKAMPKNARTTAQLHSSHTLVK